MDLLEIRYYVGKDHLSRHDLTTCTRVCKLWCDTFLPLIYRTIDLRVPAFHSLGARLPPIATVRRHGRFIRHLTISLPTPYIWELSTLAKDILTLDDHATRGKVLTAGELNQLTLLLTNNKSLRLLKLAHFHESDVDSGADSCRRLVQVVSEASTRLTELSLNQTVFSFHDVLRLLENNKDLKVLSIDHIGGFHVRMPKRHAEWLVHAPQLVSLTLNRLKNNEAPPPTRNNNAPADKQPPRLFRVKFRDPDMLDNELIEFLEKCPYLTEIAIAQTRIGMKGFEALARFFGQIAVLDLFECESANSWLCGAILQSCPKLVDLSCRELIVADYFTSFKGKGLRAEMAEATIQLTQRHQQYEPDDTPRQWVCTGLQRLRVHTLTWPAPSTDQGQNAKKCMAGLERLEELTIFRALYTTKTGKYIS